MFQAAENPSIPVPAPRPTPLALALGADRLVPLQGALTPSCLDAIEVETALLLSAAAVHDLGFLSPIRVKGEDRFRWLSGMITNTVEDLARNGLNRSLVLNAQGRILGLLDTWRRSDELTVVVARDLEAKLLAHFDHFIIMDDVELVPEPGRSALGLTGPRAAEILAALGLPAPKELETHSEAQWQGQTVQVARTNSTLAPRFELWTAEAAIPELLKALGAAGAGFAGAEAMESLRLAEGTPLYAIDIAERDLPQETSQTGTLNFSKGCYIGQEIVERIRSRGQVHRHLRQLELDGPLAAAGTELSYSKADGAAAPAGLVSSAAEIAWPGGARRFALAMIRAEAELRPQALTYTTPAGNGAARILAAPPAIESN